MGRRSLVDSGFRIVLSLILLVFWACNSQVNGNRRGGKSGGAADTNTNEVSNDNSGSVAGRGKSTANSGSGGAPNNAPDCKTQSCASEDSDTQISGANLIDFNNARVACDFINQGKSDYQILCHAVAILPNGISVAASGIAPGYTLGWLPPVVANGSATGLACKVDARQLKQTCQVHVQTSNVAVNLSLKVGDSRSKVDRTETAVVLLPYSVGVASGLVLTAAQTYQATSFMNGVGLMETTALDNSGAGPHPLGFQSNLVLGKNQTFGILTGACAIGNSIFFAADRTIWEIMDGDTNNIQLFAGSASTDSDNDYSHSLRIHFRGSLTIACGAKDVYVFDAGSNNRLMRIEPSSRKTKLMAWDGSPGVTQVDPIKVPTLKNGICAMAEIQDHSLVFTNWQTNLIAGISSEGKFYTIAGDGDKWVGAEMRFGGDGGPATLAKIDGPYGLAAGSDGSLFFADSANSRVRKIDPQGKISTIAGDGRFGFSGDGGPAVAASFDTPTKIAVDIQQNIYVMDSRNYRIRKIDRQGVISTFAGKYPGGSDGEMIPALSANISSGCSLVTGSPTLLLACLDTGRIRQIDDRGILSTVLITNNNFELTSDSSRITQFTTEGGLAVDGMHNVYLGYFGTQLWKINSDNKSSKVAGTVLPGFSGDNLSASMAQVNKPKSFFIDKNQTLYFADTANFRIRKIDAHGVISTVTTTNPFMSEVVAVIGGITKDEQYLYYSDTLAQRIRRVDSQGNTTILVGNGMGYFNGDNIPASTASVNLPCSLEIGNDQNLYFADKGNRRIRRITIRDAVPKITTVVSSDVIPNNFSMTSMRLGSNGEFYVTDGNIIAEISNPESGVSPIFTPFFGRGVASMTTRDCGMGKVVNTASSPTDLQAKIQASLSTICPGEIINDLATLNTCTDPDPAKRSFSLVFSQSFGTAGSNIVEIQKPCI